LIVFVFIGFWCGLGLLVCGTICGLCKFLVYLPIKLVASTFWFASQEVEDAEPMAIEDIPQAH